MLNNLSPQHSSSHSDAGNQDASSGANGSTVGKGTWTKEEHERFLKATELYPQGPWKKIAEMVRTRTIRQTQTHAQKYREKLARHHRGLRTRSFGQTAAASQQSAASIPRSLPISGRSPLPPPPSHGLGGLSHHLHGGSSSSSSHLSISLLSRPLSHHLPSPLTHHHQSSSSSWNAPQLPQLPLHENSSSHHMYGNNGSSHPPEQSQNFSQSMQYLMDFYEPAVPQAHFPIDQKQSYTFYNEPVDVHRRYAYKNDP
ncbi:unnamed protein product [Aphanomyces euteiches]|nr:hypothetical protein AeRB84_013686 [Aphanomyces euteiches]